MKTNLLTSLSVIILAAGMTGCGRDTADAASSQTNNASTDSASKITEKKVGPIPAKDIAEAKDVAATLFKKTIKDCGSYKLVETHSAWGAQTLAYQTKEAPDVFVIPNTEADRLNGVQWQAVALLRGSSYAKVDLRGNLGQWIDNGGDPLRTEILKQNGRITLSDRTDMADLQGPTIPCKKMPK
jgi:ABC-type glycerol-3-phosphate transport system substrate-binding protein